MTPTKVFLKKRVTAAAALVGKSTLHQRLAWLCGNATRDLMRSIRKIGEEGSKRAFWHGTFIY